MQHCPRCGYPDRGPRYPSVTGYAGICEACAKVEVLETVRLGTVLPPAQWAVND